MLKCVVWCVHFPGLFHPACFAVLLFKRYLPIHLVRSIEKNVHCGLVSKIQDKIKWIIFLESFFSKTSSFLSHHKYLCIVLIRSEIIITTSTYRYIAPTGDSRLRLKIPYGPFTPSVSVNIATTLQWCKWYCSHWKQWCCLKMSCNPNLEWL